MRYISILTVFFVMQWFSFSAQAVLSSPEIKRLLNCYQQNLEKLNSGQEKYNFAFSSVPKAPEQGLYKLFIDKERLKAPEIDEKHAQPHLLFDVKEPGYYQAMVSAFSQLPKYITNNISLIDIEQLHDLAISGVKGGPIMQKGIYLGGLQYDIPKKKINPLAFKELFLSKVLFDSPYFLEQIYEKPLTRNVKRIIPEIAQKADQQGLFKDIKTDFLSEIKDASGDYMYVASYAPPTVQKLETMLEPILLHFQKTVKQPSLMGRLKAITEFLRAFEVAHFLSDANQRTYVFLLLNALLIANGMPPAILEDPTMFDGYMTVDEMARAVKNGIINFLQEFEAGHRHMLANQCAEGRENNLWLTAKDNYIPYHQKGSLEKVIEKAKNCN